MTGNLNLGVATAGGVIRELSELRDFGAGASIGRRLAVDEEDRCERGGTEEVAAGDVACASISSITQSGLDVMVCVSSGSDAEVPIVDCVADEMETPEARTIEVVLDDWATVTPGIQRTPAGKFRVRLRTGKKRITIGVFASLAEAQRALAAAREELAKRKNKRRPTLGSWLVTWLDRRAAAGLRNIAVDRHRVAKHVTSSALAKIPLDDLCRRDVSAWLRELEAKHVDTEGCRIGWSRKKAAEMRAAGGTPKPVKRRARATEGTKRLSRQTRKHLLNLVRGALGAAVEEGLLAENPAAGIKLAPETRTEEGSTVLTPDEQQRLLSAIPLPERHVVAFAIGAGLRLGEQWSLELGDLHLGAADPHVIVRYGGAGHAPTKTGEPRSIPLFGIALNAARAWIANMSTWCKRVHVLAWPTERGYHRGRKAPKGWKSWLKAAGIERRVRWHDLRHTCASALVSGQWGRRWSLEEVKAYLGHSSVKTTERYARFAGDALTTAARETNAAHSAAMGVAK
jgi:integrase